MRSDFFWANVSGLLLAPVDRSIALVCCFSENVKMVAFGVAASEVDRDGCLFSLSRYACMCVGQGVSVDVSALLLKGR